MKLSVFILSLLPLFISAAAFASDVKTADLAGSWYPREKSKLMDLLESYLKDAKPVNVEGRIFAIIAPHAGYQFSGPVAAYSYRAVMGKGFKTAIIVGFSHRQYFDGISVYAKGSWRTPLGDIAVDEKVASVLLKKSGRIKFEPRLFDGENSVEMQVPFVQAALGNIKIVPIEFGTQDLEDARILGEALAEVIKDNDGCLIIASTDLSHYHPYKEAVSIDNGCIKSLETLNAEKFFLGAQNGKYELCGLMPVSAAIVAANMAGGSSVEVLKYANSGDTYGDKSQVVGYLSAVIYQPAKESSSKSAIRHNILTQSQRNKLLKIARESIQNFVVRGKRKEFTEADPVLNKELGAFVTLHENGQLRGCIGNMIGRGPLYKTIADMAIESATGDPRFHKLEPGEIENTEIEISVLSPLKKVDSYKDVTIPGDGVLIRRGFSSGVFLPQVAEETGWNREEFLSCLCSEKAGLPSDAWKDPKTEIYVFTAEVFSEKGEVDEK